MERSGSCRGEERSGGEAGRPRGRTQRVAANPDSREGQTRSADGAGAAAGFLCHVSFFLDLALACQRVDLWFCG